MVWFHISSGTLVLNIKTLAFGPIFLPRSCLPCQRNHAIQGFGNFFHGHLALLFLVEAKAGTEGFRSPRNLPNFRRILRKPFKSSYQSWLLVSRLKCSRLDLFLCLQVGFLSASRLLLKKSLFKISQFENPKKYCGQRHAACGLPGIRKDLVFFFRDSR